MKTIKIDAQLNGLAPIMFDRFFDHSGEERQPDQKLYLVNENVVVLPFKNLEAFLTGEKPAGAVKMTEKKKTNDFLPYVKAHVSFSASYFPFLDENGKPIVFGSFADGRFEVDISSPRVIKGSLSIKMPPTKRPVLNLPWSLKIGINLVETELSKGKITPEKLESWFRIGGLVVALGTYRPLYGRFEVAQWKIVKN